MSHTAVEIATPHTFGRIMVETMARPLNSWVNGDPYAPRHTSYYPAEHAAQGTRLPPPSSLISGAPTHSLPQGRDPHPIKTNYYGQHDYQTPSPIQQLSPPLPPPTSEPHHLAHISQGRRHGIDLSRISPTLSSTASERSAEDTQDGRLRHIRDQNPAQLPGIRSPVRHQKRPSREDPYRDVHQAKTFPPPPYPAPHVTQAAQPASPQNRQIWSPRSEAKTERVKISDLLSDEPRPGGNESSTPMPPVSVSMPESEYKIRVRQQPVAARSCGFGERDRRVIDPPPIVQLTIEDPNLSQEEIARRIRHPFSVVHCSIWNETGDQDNSAMPEDYRQQRRLMGTLVASPFVGLDENGEEGCFFCFPDLSCRTPGSFRLKFLLVVLDPTRMRPGGKSPVRASAMSDVFTVYNAKDFPGMTASTPLTKKLKEQGCLISIKKGNDKNTHARDDSDSEDGEEGSSEGKRKRKKKRT
jgi:hypothetical protein